MKPGQRCTHSFCLITLISLGILAGCGKATSDNADTRMTVSDKLLQERAVLLGLPINDQVATELIAKLLFLESKSTSDSITLYINSPGGSATAGLAIVETIETLKPKVHTVCIGQAHSMAAIILTCGSAGNRVALTNAVISFGDVWAGGPVDAERQKQIARMQAVLVDKTSRATGLAKAKVEELFASKVRLTATEAQGLNIIDHEASRASTLR